MATGIPLPKVVSDVGPGGPLVTAMGGMNALGNNMLKTQYQSILNKYAPITLQAKAASEMAYANLLGPQYVAKMMGNPNILANIPDEQKRNLLSVVTNAGTAGQRMPLSTLANPQASESTNNALLSSPGLSNQDRNAIQNMQPGESYSIQGAPPQSSPPQSLPSPSAQLPSSSFAENVGKYEGVQEEGKELGKIRAKDIESLNDTLMSGENNRITLDSISDILGSPEFEQIRQNPLMGNHELGYYAKEGTPAQQKMVGNYLTLTGQIIQNSARDFPGQFRKGEQALLQGMKPTTSDTVDVAKGKIEALSYMNQLLTERARLTSQLMTKYHMNKGEALELADQQLNGDKIRKDINSRLYPLRGNTPSGKVRVREKSTGKEGFIPANRLEAYQANNYERV